MSHTQNKSITVGPDGIFWIKAEELGPDSVGNRSHGHGCSWMARVCLLNTIHRESTDSVDGCLFFGGKADIGDVGVLGVMVRAGGMAGHFEGVVDGNYFDLRLQDRINCESCFLVQCFSETREVGNLIARSFGSSNLASKRFGIFASQKLSTTSPKSELS
jgi:hypothetical protein